jgi:hypothetical protein
LIGWLDRLTCYDRLLVWLDDEHCLMIRTAWWWERLDKNDLMRTTWWWERLDDENDLMMRTTWWWERLDDENNLMMRTIYLSTLNWADKEFFLIFLYIASLEQAWQNPSNTNPRVGLRAPISPTRSNTNPRVGFELLSETQLYGQATFDKFCYYHMRWLISNLNLMTNQLNENRLR